MGNTIQKTPIFPGGRIHFFKSLSLIPDTRIVFSIAAVHERIGKFDFIFYRDIDSIYPSFIITFGAENNTKVRDYFIIITYSDNRRNP
jgi:hypothetical protein